MDKRATDYHRQQDQMLADHIAADENFSLEILEKLKKIETAQTSMLEMLQVFDSIKGFWTVCRMIGIVTLGVGSVFGVVTAAGYAFRAWAKS